MKRTTSLAACLLTLACGDGSGAGAESFGGVGLTASGGSGDDGSTESGAFAPEQVFELRLNDEVPPPLILELDHDQVADLFGEAAEGILILELDPTALLTGTLEEIKNACGTMWTQDSPDPQPDCSLTPLGQSFVGWDGTWQTSSEYALIRVITTTPANVDVTGTSSESLADVADFLGVGGGFRQLLADMLGIARTDPVVPTPALAQTFRDNFVASHPAVGEGGKLRLYLDDALNDLATLRGRYGPAAGHPGIVDPSFEPHGEVFGPDFQLRAEATSNLRLVDGVDAGGGKGFLSVIVDTVGPTFEDEIEFDFSDPDKFQLSGLAEQPVVDLRFQLSEVPYFVPSCLGNPPCHGNLPGAPVDPLSVWSGSPWTFEYNVTAGAMNRYQDRVFFGSYLLGGAQILVGQNGDPPGWIEYDVVLGLGSPPLPQYVWETVLEVAQVELHNTPFGNFAEGDVDVAFTVFDIPVGIDGAQAAEAVRPHLQEQASALSDILLGDFHKNNDPVDFYYRRASDGAGYLFFVGPEDLAKGAPYNYDAPGFYSSEDRRPETKLSRKEIPGLADATHEKLPIGPGETTVYIEDGAGRLHRVRVAASAQGATTVEVAVAPQIQ